MSIRGRWRVVETPDYDMATPASYIFFGKTSGEFALDCLTGSIHGGYEGDAVEFTWEGNDEMEPARGDGWAELQDDGSLEGEISLETATTSPSSLAERSLLQHPARAPRSSGQRELFSQFASASTKSKVAGGKSLRPTIANFRLGML